MKKIALVVFFGVLLVGLGFNLSWAQCPEDTDDPGICDTLYVELYDSANNDIGGYTGSWPRRVYLPVYITHDVPTPLTDSLAGIVVPLGLSHTNSAAYCSVSSYWNTTSSVYLFPDFLRSIFRPFPESTDSSRMGLLGNDLTGRDWDTKILDLKTDPDSGHFWLSAIATGTQDQRWAEGSRVLLATATLEVEDSMTITIDSTFWPPTNRLMFQPGSGPTFIPRIPTLPCTVCVMKDTSYYGKCVWEGVEDFHQLPGVVPDEFLVSQNYPNPFNATTTIEFGIAQGNKVSIWVFNVLGQRVETLMENKPLERGTYTITWDAKDVSSGVYFYQIQAGDITPQTKKMILLK